MDLIVFKINVKIFKILNNVLVWVNASGIIVNKIKIANLCLQIQKINAQYYQFKLIPMLVLLNHSIAQDSKTTVVIQSVNNKVVQELTLKVSAVDI